MISMCTEVVGLDGVQEAEENQVERLITIREMSGWGIEALAALEVGFQITDMVDPVVDIEDVNRPIWHRVRMDRIDGGKGDR